MRLRAFYTSIYNIRLGLIKIESKTGRDEVKAKLLKKMGSPMRSGLPRRGIPSPRWSRQWPEDKSRVCLGEVSLRLGGANNGQKLSLGFA